MADSNIQYLGRYGLNHSLNMPSSIIRRIESSEVFTVEICNPGTPWREDMDLMRYFFGLSDDAIPLTPEKATNIVSQWQKNWFS